MAGGPRILGRVQMAGNRCAILRFASRNRGRVSGCSGMRITGQVVGCCWSGGMRIAGQVVGCCWRVLSIWLQVGGCCIGRWNLKWLRLIE